MAETTETIAADLGKSPRQVINYKKAVERHIGGVITFQQGKQHFYREEYVHLIRLYAKGEPLPIVHRQVEVLPPMQAEPPQPNRQPPGELMLMTRKLIAPHARVTRTAHRPCDRQPRTRCPERSKPSYARHISRADLSRSAGAGTQLCGGIES